VIEVGVVFYIPGLRRKYLDGYTTGISSSNTSRSNMSNISAFCVESCWYQRYCWGITLSRPTCSNPHFVSHRSSQEKLTYSVALKFWSTTGAVKRSWYLCLALLFKRNSYRTVLNYGSWHKLLDGKRWSPCATLFGISVFRFQSSRDGLHWRKANLYQLVVGDQIFTRHQNYHVSELQFEKN